MPRPGLSGETSILVLERDTKHAHVLAQLLREEKHTVRCVKTPLEVSDLLSTARFDVLVVDTEQYPWPSLSATLGSAASPPRVIAIGGDRASPRFAGIRLAKPFDAQALAAAVRAATGALPQNPTAPRSWRSTIIGHSEAMERMFKMIVRVAPTRATVLVTGETGTGKELVARAIHEASDRAGKPFVAVNCSALPESLLESELFGHVKGSFTGAVATRRGLFEDAKDGTLFLDEISTISPATQVKLLRVLQDRTIVRVGGNKPITTDFRLIAATNSDLQHEVREGRFRGDIYYRLNVFPIRVPPLRERQGDIPLLLRHFQLQFTADNGNVVPPFAPETVARMNNYEWPGNVRELQNFVERTVVMDDDEDCFAFDAWPIQQSLTEGRILRAAHGQHWPLAQLEHAYILDILEQCHGQRMHAADILGIDRRTLYRKLKDWGLNARFPAESTDLDDDLSPL